MDTSKEYIKMCEKAEELEKLWKPCEGDFWACPCDACVNRNAKIYTVSDYDIDALNKRDLTNVEKRYAEMIKLYGRDFVDHFNEVRKGFAWLPRQDQLQEMVGDRYSTAIGLLTALNAFYQNKLTGLKLYKCSMEQLWLAFVMKEKYNKTWDGERWITS